MVCLRFLFDDDDDYAAADGKAGDKERMPSLMSSYSKFAKMMTILILLGGIKMWQSGRLLVCRDNNYWAAVPNTAVMRAKVSSTTVVENKNEAAATTSWNLTRATKTTTTKAKEEDLAEEGEAELVADADNEPKLPKNRPSHKPEHQCCIFTRDRPR